jgi:hypothetical protein
MAEDIRGPGGDDVEETVVKARVRAMNKSWVLFHLREAHEQLTRSIKDLEADATFDEIELLFDMQHVYHRLNTAWNSRNSSDAEGAVFSEEDFDAWRAFPKDLLMGE